MPKSELNRVKGEFKQHMEKSFRLIQSINKAQPPLPQDQIYMIYELSFLRIFLSWEWFIESTFILYMLGSKTDTGYSPKVYVSPKDQNHAYQFVKEGRDYADWTSPDVVIRKSSLFFKDGKPYKDTFEPIIREIQDLKTIRNAVVHMSAEAREKFKTLVRSKLGYVKTTNTPGEFLATAVKGKSLPYITYFKDLLELASERIVK